MVHRRTRPQERPRDFETVVADFGAALAPRMRGDGRLEDRLRGPINTMIERAGDWLGLSLVVHDEVTLPDLRSRPDIAVDAPSGRVGFLELKAPGTGTPETWRPTRHNREQWEKLQVLPNLVYTDGVSWALYRSGTLTGSVAKLSGDLTRGELAPADSALERLFRDFLLWRPTIPTSIRGIVAEVAPLCRLLRDQVADTMEYEVATAGKRDFSRLAAEWRNILFPVTGNLKHETDFADSYAQAVTFALLLARVDGVDFEGKSPANIAELLAKQHSLLGEALNILASSRWVGHLNVVDVLVRVIGAIDWSAVHIDTAETHSELYETFLATYDPELRRRSGTYYTPAPVARSMVNFVDNLLRTRLGRKRGFAAPDVVTIDPAMGTGTFLVEALDQAAKNLQRERRSTTVPVSHLREMFEHRLIGFEIQAAPFAVAELRMHSALRNRYGADIPPEEPRFLTNALDNPDDLPIQFNFVLYDILRESRERANRYKRDVPVTVVLGNPPWRENARKSAPWLEERRDTIKQGNVASRPSMDEFRLPGKARLSYNLSNMWTYFWRWSAWKAFEANDPAGIVALITPSAYLTSPAYAGMRKYLRQVSDEGWIIDLSPERHRSAVATRIFPSTQHPICIGVFMRSNEPNHDRPARVHYIEIAGDRARKFDALSDLTPDSAGWASCPDEWEAEFRPASDEWETFPILGDLMPWQQTGVNSNRNWVWAPDREVLERRWYHLISAPEHRKRQLFKETSDRKISLHYPERPGIPSGKIPIAAETDLHPTIAPASFRSFDRQYLIHDRRAVDRHRPELWQVQGESQIYVCEQHSHPLSNGPGLVFSTLVPNVDNFNGRGGRVLPLYRDPSGRSPNISPGLLAYLGRILEASVEANDFIAYVAAIVAHGGYTSRFKEQLKTPGIRFPLTKDCHLWQRAVSIGRLVIYLHTFGERFTDKISVHAFSNAPDERSHYLRPISADDGRLPCDFEYDPESQTLRVGVGIVGGVSRETWDYQVGGIPVLRRWLSYRQAMPRHRKVTSELDHLNSTRWTSEFDDQLLELVDTLSRCVALETQQSGLLELVCTGPLITAEDLLNEGVIPAPATATKPPRNELGLFA